MNKGVLNILGKIVLTEVALMVPSLLVALIYGDGDWIYFVGTMVPAALLGFGLSRIRPTETRMTSRDGYCIVAYGWILISLIGAVPLYCTDQFTSYFQAFFEIVSGFTTTGASVLAKPELLPHGVLFWRSFTHWIGGMGVLVFVLMIIPMKNDTSMHLVRAEVPGPIAGKLVPRMKRTSMILYGIYTVMTAVLVILLLAGGVKLYDSLCLAFGAAGTGGFAVSSAGIAGYGSAYVEVLLGVFMILFGINFNIYYLILVGRIKDALSSEEVRCFLGIIAVATAAITINLFQSVATLGETLRAAFFQVSSIITTTGYATTDFNLWPSFSRTILVLLMFIGACAGSTAGGLKVSRVVILCKSAVQEVRHMLHPHAVTAVRFEGKPLRDGAVRAAGAYLTVYMLVFTGSVLLLSFDGFDLITTFTAVATCFNNVGPGLEIVGPMGSFADFSPWCKWLLSFDMLAGRLELFPMLALFSPKTWKPRRAHAHRSVEMLRANR